MSLSVHREKLFYIVVGVVIATVGAMVKERFIDPPEFGLESRICAPLVKQEFSLVNVETGQRIPLPNNAGSINPMSASFINVGKKPLENLKIILEFHSKGAIDIIDERYTTKPEKGFGRVEIVEDGANQRGVQIALLNPGDELEYSAVISRPVTVLAYAKFPGLSYYQAKKPGGVTWTPWSRQ